MTLDLKSIIAYNIGKASGGGGGSYDQGYADGYKDGMSLYVLDSAVLWLDGIWNAGIGIHKDVLENGWVDLSGNCSATPLGTGNTVYSTHIASDGTQGGRITVPNIDPIDIVGNMTIEVVWMNKNTDSSKNQVILGRDYQKTYYLNNANQELTFWCAGKSTKLQSHVEVNQPHITQARYTYETALAKLVCDQSSSISATLGTLKASTNSLNLFGFVGNGTTFLGNIYAVRIHNRCLSDVELQHNYEIDKKRFGFV